MSQPFTIEQFTNVFHTYNLAIWPWQLLGYAAGLFVLFTLFKANPWFDRINNGILAGYWFLMGIGYHWIFFSKINKLAYAFGLLFVVQALLFLIFGVFKNEISFGIKKLDFYGFFGLLTVTYGMFIYPALGFIFGHVFPNSPVFGVAPCPTTIFTLGLLLLTIKRVPKFLLVIPLLWSLIGFLAAISLGVKEDVGLLIAGLAVTFLLFIRDKQKINLKSIAI